MIAGIQNNSRNPSVIYTSTPNSVTFLKGGCFFADVREKNQMTLSSTSLVFIAGFTKSSQNIITTASTINISSYDYVEVFMGSEAIDYTITFS